MIPFRITRPRFLAFFLLEGGLIYLVLYGLAYATLTINQDVAQPGLAATVFLASVLFSVSLFVTHWSSPSNQGSLVREAVIFGVISMLLGLFAAGGLWLGYHGGQRRISALLFLEGAVAVPLAIAVWRWISARFDVLNASRERVLIVGTGETAQQVCRMIGGKHAHDYAVIGFADEDDQRLGRVLAMGARIQTDYASLYEFAVERTERVIVALDEKRGKLPVRPLMQLRLRGLEIEDATTFAERVSGRISVESMLPSWLIFSEGFKTSALRSLIKRTIDLVLSVILLVLTTPLILLTAALVKLDSRGPILYRQSRVGRDGKEFEVLKFRSMQQDAETDGPVWAQANDDRVTRVGRVIRLLRVDELPQLLNVFKGEMSFVGPRPERGHFVRQLETKIPYYGLRLSVRPGITGWAQVEYHYAATQEDALEKLKYDLYYIKNNNPLFDLWIVLKTVSVVLRGAGAR